MIRTILTAAVVVLAGPVASACERCKVAGWNVSQSIQMRDEGKGIDGASSKQSEWTGKRKKYEEAAHKIFKQLIGHMKPVEGMTWPPKFEVVKELGGDIYNAAAWCRRDRDGQVIQIEGKAQSFVVFTMGYLELLEGDEDAIACVLGHELGHHALGHTTADFTLKPLTFRWMESHRNEADADLFGAKLALKAGYSVRNGLKVEWKGLERLGGNRGSAAVVKGTHPGTSDRAARVLAALDDPEAELWRTMAAFENGVAFLAAGNYEAAEVTFKKVAEEFAKCYEAWANLGIARLMLYCRTLSADKVRRLGLGEFIGPAHFATAASQLRATSPELWYEAVAALRRADELKGGSAIIAANLGLAYLVHPAGKEKASTDAKRFLAAAIKALPNADLLPRMEVTLLVNLGVGELAVGEIAQGRKLLDEAESLAKRIYYDRNRKQVRMPLALACALEFNKAAAMEGDNKEAAASLYEQYLTHATQSNPWWAVAYERYVVLCNDTGSRAKPKRDLGQRAPRRAHLVVALAGGKSVHVGESIRPVLKRLGKPTLETKHPSSSVRALRFEAHGVELIADQDEVFAILIVSPAGPAIPVYEAGVAGKKLGELKVGMTRAEVEEMLGKPGSAMLTSLKRDYDYFADLGVAVAYDKGGVVTSLIVGQLSDEVVTR